MAKQPNLAFVDGIRLVDKTTGLQIASLDSSLFVKGSPYDPAAIGVIFSTAFDTLESLCDALVFVEDQHDDPATKKQARALSANIRAILKQVESKSRG